MPHHNPETGPALRRQKSRKPRPEGRRYTRESGAGCMCLAAIRLLSLEDDPQTALERPVLIHLDCLVSLGRRDLPESGVAKCGIRQIEPRRVRQIIGFRPEFQAASLSELELPEDRAVDVEQPWAIQNVSPDITDGSCRRIRERGWREPILTRPLLPENLDRTYYIGPLAVT